MNDIVCFICGRKIENSGRQKTGRPVQYHKECRELNNAISLLQIRIETFKEMNPLKAKKNKIRSILWNSANGLNSKRVDE